MTQHLYDRGQLDAAIRRSAIEASNRPVKRVNERAGDLEPTRNIPAELYFNAVNGHGVDPNDFEYWKDMERYVPSIKVKATSGKMMFGAMGLHGGSFGRRNRFGRITWSKRYG